VEAFFSMTMYEICRVCLHTVQLFAIILIPVVATYLQRYLKNKDKRQRQEARRKQSYSTNKDKQ